MAIQKTAETFVLNLDPTIPLEEQIQRGNYDYINPNFNTCNFQLTLSGKREIILYDPRGSVSSEEMIRRMGADGRVPATLDDAVAFGVQFPDRQRENHLVFLGTIWSGARRVPALSDWYFGRGLCLCLFGRGWGDGCRFAADRGEK